MKKNKAKIEITNQYYLKDLLKKYPSLKSGRKNYNNYYIRVLKNILMIKFFHLNKNHKKDIILDKFKFYRKKNFLYLEKINGKN